MGAEHALLNANRNGPMSVIIMLMIMILIMIMKIRKEEKQGRTI